MLTNPPITNKQQMYSLLSQGAFGNTINQYHSIKQWQDSSEFGRYDYWGVRSLRAGGPCKLYCPTNEVIPTASSQSFVDAGVNLSVMIDAVVTVTLWCDVMQSEHGLIVYGIERPQKGASWRKEMPVNGKEHRNLQAAMLLRKHLNASSLADLEVLLEQYPDHVIELSACEECFGNVPHRNAVLWEVRMY